MLSGVVYSWKRRVFLRLKEIGRPEVKILHGVLRRVKNPDFSSKCGLRNRKNREGVELALSGILGF